ncbi:MAG: glycerophosphoryl diester phosphodiesterase membrane domain-containing protein [Chloroflexi bacterium]|nr:glycerophosphoryl diester phosphodiesterase membrane domain-containing protein [Chloroflexota bacterium]
MFIPISLAGRGAVIVFLLLLFPIISLLTTRWSLATTVAVLEDTGAATSMRRSWTLTEQHFWRVFGTSFAAGLLSMLLSTLPALFITYLFEQVIHAPIRLSTIITMVLGQLTIILTTPLTVGVYVLIYYDLRIRKEGFDLLFLSEESSEPHEIV